MSKKVTLEEIQGLLRQYELDADSHISVEAIGRMGSRLRFRIGRKHLRPGNTISGSERTRVQAGSQVPADRRSGPRSRPTQPRTLSGG